MALAAGARLGPYEIVAPLGAGGMGEVYRARDTQLKREVALKVLPEGFAQDPDRLARFQREAELLATLNHPNIAAVYGLEKTESVTAIVLELVEGDTLDARLKARAPSSDVARGFSRATTAGLPLDEVLVIARQIAEALEAAHEKGVIHRDLKPANIKITPDAKVKVLDFGLAKLVDVGSPEGSPYTASVSPTLSVHGTFAGTILGTAAYMSPEQARGKPVDRRTDIWAFGCVLYEMLTGRQAFDTGDTVSDAIAAILKTDVDWTALPADVPDQIRLLLKRCLEKDRATRIGEIGTARFLLTETIAPPATTAAPVATTPVAAAVVSAWRRALPWALVVAALAGAGLALWAPWRTAPLHAPLRMSVELGADVSLPVRIGSTATLSPDGSVLAFTAQKGDSTTTQLYVRRLDQLRATPLSGTDGALDAFFSPDGQWIAFFADARLKKISITGGAAISLCDAPTDRGGTWADDGTIVFQADTGVGLSLMRVSSAGGKAEPFVKPAESGTSPRWPQVLPGGRAVLYTAGTGGAFEDANIVVQPLPSGTPKVVQHGGYYAHYLSSGHLVYLHEGTLFAAPFSLERLELTGQAVPVVEGVSGNVGNGSAQFAVSESGTLIYVPGQSIGFDVAINWMDRMGKTTVLRTTSGNWSNPHFSPDGQRLAIDIADGKQIDVWVYEWARDTATKLTFDPADDVKPVWTPDGRRIAFASRRGRGGVLNLYWQHADGTGDAQRLTESANAQLPGSWHPSGKFLAFQETNPQTGNDLMILPMSGDESSGWKPGKPTVFLSTPATEVEPMFSPDGRWLAYHSNETGRNEVYVRPFPGPGGKWQISTASGSVPTWSRVRRELFYRGIDNRIMVASYTAEGDSFRADKPRAWSERPSNPRPRQRVYDLHPDGDRMALSATADSPQSKQDKVVFIFNFFDELRRVAPAGRK